MPQMAPISWLLLFITFFITFIMFNMMNYYMYFPSTPKFQQMNKIIFSMNWKW
nr:ATP synthase F0 subunit 8 [Phytobia cambii]